MTTPRRLPVHPRAAAAAASLLLVIAAIPAWRQRDLLDPARLHAGTTATARLLHERQRYGPGDAGEFDRLLAELGADEAERIFVEMTEFAPTWGAYHYALGLVPMARGEWDAADARFAQAAALAPNDAGLAERIGAAWTRTAEERRDPKLLLYGFPHFARAARLDPALLRHTVRLLTPFAVDVRGLSPLVPDTPQGRMQFGILLAEAGLAADAIPPLAQAVREPGGASEDAWSALGRSYLSLGRTAKAEAAFREALKLSRDPTAYVRGLYDVFGAAGRADEGVKFWERLADEHPRGARFNLGRSHFDAGTSGHAAAMAEFRSIENVVRDPFTTGYLARIEIARGSFADANARLERALRLHRRDADLHYLMARALRGLGDRAGARAELSRARELSPAEETFVKLFATWEEEDRRR